MIGYIIKKEGENKYYAGSGSSAIICGFYGAKIYKQMKFAKEALRKALKYDKDFKIYEVEVLIKEEVKEWQN